MNNSFSNRRGALAALFAAILTLFLIMAGFHTAANPSPQAVAVEVSGASIYFSTSRTNFIFPMQCSQVEWRLERIKAVLFENMGEGGTGSKILCTGDTPSIFVTFQDDTQQEFTLPRQTLLAHPLAAITAVIALLLWGVALHAFVRGQKLTRRGAQYAIVVGLALLLIGVMKLYTGDEYLVIGPTYDAARTLEIAQNGLVNNPNLWAPWAYRPLTPLLARALADVFARPVEFGFAVVTVAGMLAQLVLVYALARHFRASFRAGLLAMAAVALSYYHLRFSLADIYRPDQLGYPLILLAMLLLFREQRVWCILICAFGLLVREFLIIPAVILGLQLLCIALRQRSAAALVALVGLLLVVGATLWLPRALIPVADTAQRFDPQHRTISMVYDSMVMLSNMPRNLEFLAALVGYGLPVLLLATGGRLRHLWTQLAGYRWILGLYILLAVALSLVGGSGMNRYITYMVVPLVLVLALWLDDVPDWEAWVWLALIALANRLFWMPNLDAIGKGVLVGALNYPQAVIPRLLEAGFLLAVMAGVRLYG